MNRQTSSTAAQTEESRYRLLVDAITDYAICMLGPDGRVSSWNAGAQRIKGYRADEIIGSHFSRFYTPEEREAGIPALALRTAAEEGRFEREGWRVRKDGSRFWAHVVIDPIRGSDGQIIGFAKITRDLTERRQAEEALRRSEEQFRLLVQGVTDYALYMLGSDGRVSSWNAGAQRIKGYGSDEIIGQHFSRFYTPEDREAGIPALALRTAAEEGRFEAEGWRMRKDGTRFWAHVLIDPIRNEAGEVIGFAKITRDMSERNEAQKALEAAREALFQSQKLDAIGQLTGGVAHDFNNLLMAVLGSLELVRKRLPDDPKTLALIDNAIQGAERGAALTRRLLAFARKQELKTEAVDLAALVHGMRGLLERALGPAVRIETDFPENLEAVRGDANQLETALLNLAVNARDAMPGGGLIRIAARACKVGPRPQAGLAPGEYVRLSVSDEGEGMDAGTLARAAEPFFTTKDIGKGTGLGLPMVHGMVEQSGGRMTITSRPGEGATVELWLPKAHAGEAAHVFDAEAGEGEQPMLGPLTVLAVDDDSLVLMNTVAMLEELGCRALPAISARDALALLTRERVDVVVTDHAMPEQTGVQLAKALRALHPDLPVILATGFADVPGGEAQGLPRLSKPFGQAELARAIGKAVGANPASPRP